MKRHLIILTAYLCACLSLFAQQRTLKGKVTDQADNSPIPAVTVTTFDKNGTRHGVLTDMEGTTQSKFQKGLRP